MADPKATLEDMIEAEENNNKLLESEIGKEPETAAVLREVLSARRRLIARFKMAITALQWAALSFSSWKTTALTPSSRRLRVCRIDRKQPGL